MRADVCQLTVPECWERLAEIDRAMLAAGDRKTWGRLVENRGWWAVQLKDALRREWEHYYRYGYC